MPIERPDAQTARLPQETSGANEPRPLTLNAELEQPERSAALADLCRLANLLCQTPIALIALADGRAVRLFSPLNAMSYAAYDLGGAFDRALRTGRICVASDPERDAALNALFGDATPVGIQFCAMAPLWSEAGRPCGVLCLMDVTSRDLTDAQCAGLEALGRQIIATLEATRPPSHAPRPAPLHRTAEDLRLAEARLRAAQRLAHIGTWEYDSRTRKLVWSEEVYALFELDPAQGEPTLEISDRFVHSEDRQNVRDTIRRVLHSGEVAEFDMRIQCASGAEKHLHAIAYPIHDARGATTGLLGTLMDVTLQKRMEESFHQHRAELEEFAERRTEELQEAIEFMQQEISERQRVEEEVVALNIQLERRLQREAALRQIDMAISASMDLRHTLDIFLDQALAQLGLDAACILIANPHSPVLEYAASKGFRSSALRFTRLAVGSGYAGRVALHRSPVHIPDLNATPGAFLSAPLLLREGFISYLAVPLLAKGQVRGVLELFHREAFQPDIEWQDFLAMLAGQAAIAIDNSFLFEGLQRSNVELMLAYDATIEGWARALELRDRETEGHAQRVTMLTLQLARALGVPEADMVAIRRGALLHDIGKMGVPDQILHKPGPLSEEERQVMMLHTEYAYSMLSPIAFLHSAMDIPYCHHEKWDGTGYPRRLKGDEIPLAARIFAIVDVWDALRSERPYKPAWAFEEALAQVKALSGTHFDPRIVEAFVAMMTHDAQAVEELLPAA